ncbi:FG-GAP repeat domain-containing protein [Maribacter antarcticus]|uniref:FG-GAP repeat domain-containing protein n=1 Tax=Maribacter antarcticus TaxID=505250 RepID=UPI0009FEC778|nr:VCBS repeat-containing protein [Maribacter antarcticus]
MKVLISLIKYKSYYLPVFLLVPLLSVWAQVKIPPITAVSFKKVQLLDKYVTEGASIGDIDMDGNMDIVAGVLWWKGPYFKESFAYAPVKYYPITGPGLEGYATNFFTFPYLFDGNKWMDMLCVGLPGTNSNWVKDPGKTQFAIGDSIPEPAYRYAMMNVCHESPNLVDVIGDEKKELLAFSEGRLVLGIPTYNSKEGFRTVAISPQDPKRFPVYSHGLGAGDINGDGLNDVFERSGWWEQPAEWDESTLWKYHPYPFSSGTGGAQMFAYDVNGDGANDVVTAKNGHGYGLSWFEQLLGKDGITFKEHKVMTDKAEENPYGVNFSQLHAVSSADIDNDGIPDIVTGKCYYAHNGRDPGSEDPAVLYWFKTVRHADGTAELVPYKIDDDSGVGRQISTGDLNNDGKIDIVTANKKGVFAFIQN